jgi:hypothetical protein
MEGPRYVDWDEILEHIEDFFITVSIRKVSTALDCSKDLIVVSECYRYIGLMSQNNV